MCETWTAFSGLRMRPQEIIARKRDGGSLSEEQIEAFIDGVCDGGWADYQVSALLTILLLTGVVVKATSLADRKCILNVACGTSSTTCDPSFPADCTYCDGTAINDLCEFFHNATCTPKINLQPCGNRWGGKCAAPTGTCTPYVPPILISTNCHIPMC